MTGEAQQMGLLKRLVLSPWRTDEKAHMDRGRLTLMIFMVVLVVIIILADYIRVPIQTVLIILAVVIMVIGRAKVQDLMAGLILHPIMAMTAGFLIAGALGLAGGFDVLIKGLAWLAELEIAPGLPLLGWVGVAVILANIPTIMPMPCGRILAAALMLGVFLFAAALAAAYGLDLESNEASVMISALVAGFIVNAAASCGPSTLGGIGGIGEGNLGLPIGRSARAQSAGILIATGICTLVIALVVQPVGG
jgi:hypothetical protein